MKSTKMVRVTSYIIYQSNIYSYSIADTFCLNCYVYLLFIIFLQPGLTTFH